MNLSRSVLGYTPTKDDGAVEQKLRSLAEQYPTRGFESYYGRIRNQGLKWNRKRVLRIYRKLGLQIRRKKKQRLPKRSFKSIAQPITANYQWSMDFMEDSLDGGRRFRTLNIMDDYNRQALCVYVNPSITGKRVVEVLKQLVAIHGYPKRIRVDNGPEFISHVFTDWCKEKVEIDYIQPGKPVQNAFIERLNRLYREDVLDAYLFENINDVRIKTDQWVADYNSKHPHSSLLFCARGIRLN